MTETRDKILDTAERLFGDQGYAATSLRQIIAEAGVNLAAIHYHFGTKEDLLSEMVGRKAAPVNEERLALLDRYEREAGGGAVALERLIEAFLRPPLARIQEHPGFAKLMGRLYGEGLMPRIAERHFQTVKARFFSAFAKALPELGPEALPLRLQFVLGAMAHTMLFAGQFNLSDVPFPTDLTVLVNELTSFATAGLRAPQTARAALHEDIEVTK